MTWYTLKYLSCDARSTGRGNYKTTTTSGTRDELTVLMYGKSTIERWYNRSDRLYKWNFWWLNIHKVMTKSLLMEPGCADNGSGSALQIPGPFTFRSRCRLAIEPWPCNTKLCMPRIQSPSFDQAITSNPANTWEINILFIQRSMLFYQALCQRVIHSIMQVGNLENAGRWMQGGLLWR